MSRKDFQKTGKPEYLEFIRLRSEQMLRDNKALTSAAKAEVRGLLEFAKKHEK